MKHKTDRVKLNIDDYQIIREQASILIFLIDWLIDWLMFYAVLAIVQKYYGDWTLIEKKDLPNTLCI
jgi:hypothetical protein